jgi:hypothetical protein
MERHRLSRFLPGPMSVSRVEVVLGVGAVGADERLVEVVGHLGLIGEEIHAGSQPPPARAPVGSDAGVRRDRRGVASAPGGRAADLQQRAAPLLGLHGIAEPPTTAGAPFEVIFAKHPDVNEETVTAGQDGTATVSFTPEFGGFQEVRVHSVNAAGKPINNMYIYNFIVAE